MRVPGLPVGRLAFRRRRDHWDHPGQVEERSRDGKFTPEAERQVREALAKGLARSASDRLLAAPVAAPVMKAGTRPYPDTIPVSQVTAYRIAAAAEFFIPRPGFEATPGRAPETAPMPVLPANVKVPPPPPAPLPAVPGDVLAMTEVLTLRRIRDGLQGLDWDALDAARAHDQETYARTAGAPFHNALLAGWRSPVRPVRRHGEAVSRKAGTLDYPEFDAAEVAGMGAYAGVMRHADRITGTRGTGRFRPALTSGGAA
jgi:hypothetical protein